jgi:hypothetical protein
MSKQNKKDSKSNLRILITFLIILAASLTGGFLVGRLVSGAKQTDILVNFACAVKDFFNGACPVLFLIAALLGILLPLASFLSCNILYKKLQNDKENDALWDILEERLNRPLVLANTFFMVILCLFFCVLITGIRGNDLSALFRLDFLLFVVSCFSEMLILKFTIDIEKKLNPEKQGNVLDMKFQQVWMNSCDEAQKLTAYKAGFWAFQTTNAACLILILASFICSLAFQTDLVSLLFVCVIWFVNNLSYMLRAAKLEKGK